MVIKKNQVQLEISLKASINMEKKRNLNHSGPNRRLPKSEK